MGMHFDVSCGMDNRLVILRISGAFFILFCAMLQLLVSPAWGATVTEPVRRFGYGCLRSMAFSPDGNHVAIVYDDGRARLFDVATSTPLHTFTMNGLLIWECVFSPDGSRLLTVSVNAVQLWNTATGKSIQTFTGVKSPYAISPDGSQFLSGGSATSARLWNVATGMVVKDLDNQTTVSTMAFSQDGTKILTGSLRGHTVTIWDAPDCLTSHTIPVSTSNSFVAAFSPDHARIHICNANRALILDASTGAVLHSFQDPANIITGSALSANGARFLVGYSDGTARLWDVGTGNPQVTFPAKSNRIDWMGFSQDGSKLMTGVDEGPDAWIWNAQTGQILHTIKTGVTKSISSVAISRDASRIASGGDLTVWDTATGQPITTSTGISKVYSLDFSSDGKKILFVPSSGGSLDFKVHLWEIGTRKTLLTIDSPYCADADFSPDGTKFLTGYGYTTFAIRDTLTGYMVRVFNMNDIVYSVAWSRNGSRVLAWNGLDEVRIWNAETGALVRTFKEQGVKIWLSAISPDGRLVLNGTRLMDVETGECLRTFDAGVHQLTSIAFSPDGTKILTTGGGSSSILYDELLRLWDTNTGELLHSFYDNYSEHGANSAVFSSDGKMIVTGSSDGVVRLWRIPIPDPPNAAREWRQYDRP